MNIHQSQLFGCEQGDSRYPSPSPPAIRRRVVLIQEIFPEQVRVQQALASLNTSRCYGSSGVIRLEYFTTGWGPRWFPREPLPYFCGWMNYGLW